MSVQIQVKCTNCGYEYNSTVLHFCPNCSQNVTLQEPKTDIKDTSNPINVGFNHCRGGV